MPGTTGTTRTTTPAGSASTAPAPTGAAVGTTRPSAVDFGSLGGGPFGGPGGPFGEGPRGHRGGPRGGRGRHGRAGRGDVRSALLLLLADEPMHGYQLMQAVADRTGGAWRLSPGAVYPTIAQLEDEGLVMVSADGGRKLVTLTEAGREHLASLGDVDPFAAFAGDGDSPDLRALLGELMGAAHQLGRRRRPDPARRGGARAHRRPARPLPDPGRPGRTRQPPPSRTTTPRPDLERGTSAAKVLHRARRFYGSLHE